MSAHTDPTHGPKLQPLKHEYAAGQDSLLKTTHRMTISVQVKVTKRSVTMSEDAQGVEFSEYSLKW